MAHTWYAGNQTAVAVNAGKHEPAYIVFQSSWKLAKDEDCERSSKKGKGMGKQEKGNYKGGR